MSDETNTLTPEAPAATPEPVNNTPQNPVVYLDSNEKLTGYVKAIRANRDWRDEKGRITWKQVFKDRPEWVSLLGGDSDQGLLRLQQIAYGLKRSEDTQGLYKGQPPTTPQPLSERQEENTRRAAKFGRNLHRRCALPGCEFVAHGSTDVAARRTLSRHQSMAHGIRGKTSARYDKYHGRARPLPEPPQNGIANPSESVAPNEPAPSVNFCPRCGFNLVLHQTAFRVADKNSPK